MWRALAVAVALMSAPLFGAGCSETLDPALLHELPLKTLRRVRGVAWINGGTLAIAARNGVFRYNLADQELQRIISAEDVPDGLPNAENVAVDGDTLVAYNMEYSDLAFDLARQKITAARRVPAMQVLAMDVHDGNLVVLGYPAILPRDREGALWIGGVGKRWETFRAIHSISDREGSIFRSGMPWFGGAVRVLSDGTIAMITPAQPGVRRYRLDGTQLPPLGAKVTELVVPRLTEVRGALSQDLAAQYEQIFNRQPIADDLLDTGDGPAIVVRRAAQSGVWWELWFPSADGGVSRKVRLGLDDPSRFAGHLRCDGRGRRIACLFGKTTSLRTPEVPYVALFDLDRVTRRGSCGR